MCQNTYKSLIINSLVVFAVVIGVFLFCRCFQLTRISGQSMEPTLRNKQIVLVQKDLDSYDTNNVITFNTKEYGVCVKRVIGTTGDTIELKTGNVYRNGIALAGYNCESDVNEIFQLTENQLFVMGDNAKESIDSRNYGPINISDVIGKVL